MGAIRTAAEEIVIKDAEARGVTPCLEANDPYGDATDADPSLPPHAPPEKASIADIESAASSMQALAPRDFILTANDKRNSVAVTMVRSLNAGGKPCVGISLTVTSPRFRQLGWARVGALPAGDAQAHEGQAVLVHVRRV